MHSIPSLKNPVVRDLAHSCFGPNLIDTFSHPAIQSLKLDLSAERKQGLQELDQNPEPLLIHLSDLKSRRLGLYFEALWKFFLLHDTQLELIAHNIPIRNDERTLGELDVVYRDRSSGVCTHLELAVKFYLNYQTSHCSNNPSDFLGPNCKDRLDKKLERFISHQSPLSDTPEAKKVLAAMDIHTVQKKIALKGQLFYFEPFQPAADCHPLSNHHQKGRWNHLSAFHKTAHQHKHWVILDKGNWLSPIQLLDIDENSEHILMSPDQLLAFLGDAFKTDQRPRIVCPMIQTGPILHEMGRHFITPDDWPTALAE